MFFLSTSDSYCLIYHWWNDSDSSPAYSDMKNPIIPSIATVRAHNSEIDIFVLDVSETKNNNWGEYPEILNFQVISTESKSFSYNRWNKLCSRVWDVFEFANKSLFNKFIFHDSDIFWIKNIFPLENEENNFLEGFNCSSNTGVWYWDKRSAKAQITFDTWKSMILLGCADEDFLESIKKYNEQAKRGIYQDEIVFGHLIISHRSLYCPIPDAENFTIDNLRFNHGDLSKNKCLHGLGATLGYNRGLVCLLIKELWHPICRVLDEKQRKEVFGHIIPNKCFSMHEIKDIEKNELIEFLKFTGNENAFIANKTKTQYINQELTT